MSWIIGEIEIQERNDVILCDICTLFVPDPVEIPPQDAVADPVEILPQEAVADAEPNANPVNDAMLATIVAAVRTGIQETNQVQVPAVQAAVQDEVSAITWPSNRVAAVDTGSIYGYSKEEPWKKVKVWNGKDPETPRRLYKCQVKIKTAKEADLKKMAEKHLPPEKRDFYINVNTGDLEDASDSEDDEEWDYGYSKEEPWKKVKVWNGKDPETPRRLYKCQVKIKTAKEADLKKMAEKHLPPEKRDLYMNVNTGDLEDASDSEDDEE
ncbi:hypothetical protein AC249_AIPGENE5042 [Exaiptasia diaphana]|nr:hypothetical protein AC249_AIPGENE5042 [Exaiptasia diaphana]